MIEFYKGVAPKGFKKDFESFLFNTNVHQKTQSKTGWKEFHLINKSKKKILASVAFHVAGNLARSPLKAPFGSYEFSDTVSHDKLSEFINAVDDSLMNIGVQKVEIINHPEIYHRQHKTLVFSLIHLGYSPFQCHVSCGIKVDRKPLIEKMNKGKRKQLRHCLKIGLTFKKIPISRFNDIYDFIALCREERNQTLSLSRKELSKIIVALPKDFMLVGVYRDKELIAASVCVRISKKILYTFYSAHLKKYDTLSPLTFLLSNLYDECFKNGFNLLDMGTSNINGTSNFNLLDFKLRIGGTMSPKFSFRKTLG